MFENKHPETHPNKIITSPVVTRVLYGESYIVKGKLLDEDREVEAFLHSSHIDSSCVTKQWKWEKKFKFKKDEGDVEKEEKDEEISLEIGDKINKNVRVKEFNYFVSLPIVTI